MTLKISFKNHLLLFKWILILSLGYIGIIVYKDHFIATIAIAILYGIQLIPQIILHLKYYFVSRNKEYFIDRNYIKITSKGAITTISKEEIKGIVLVKPAVLDDGWYLQTMGLQSYFYLKITIQNNENMILTNLLDPNIDIILKDNGYSFYREKAFGWF